MNSRSMLCPLLRMWQSWVLSLLVLTGFDISRVRMFGWVENRQVFRYNVQHPDATQLELEQYRSKLRASFPSWFDDASKVYFSFSDFLPSLPDIGEVDDLLECI